MCLAESESISRRAATAGAGCVELCFARTETDRCLFQTPIAHCYVLYIAMYPVTLWRVVESPAQSESLRPTSSIIPFLEPFRAVLDEVKYCACL